MQDNARVKSINLDVQSYVNTLEIATIQLVFNDFYSIVFFSKQWTMLDIFLKKSTNNVLAFKIFSFNLPAKQRVKI